MLTLKSRTVGVEEAVKEAQQGGSGVVIYFRKEGRALGEVTKYLGKPLLMFRLYALHGAMSNVPVVYVGNI